MEASSSAAVDRDKDMPPVEPVVDTEVAQAVVVGNQEVDSIEAGRQAVEPVVDRAVAGSR